MFPSLHVYMFSVPSPHTGMGVRLSCTCLIPRSCFHALADRANDVFGTSLSVGQLRYHFHAEGTCTLDICLHAYLNSVDSSSVNVYERLLAHLLSVPLRMCFSQLWPSYLTDLFPTRFLHIQLAAPCRVTFADTMT